MTEFAEGGYAIEHLNRNGEGDYSLIDDQGISWDTVENYIGISVFGFCGCGCPEVALKFYRAVLRFINEPKPQERGREAWDVWWKEHRVRADAIFHGDDGIEYAAYYVLDDKKLIEHGGSVPGWLTGKGEQVLADLESFALND